jgi:[acyl-carrier-protein] S-malonyltransferase
MTAAQRVAFLFPGQGAQMVGMGQSLVQHSDTAKDIFDLFDAIVTPNAQASDSPRLSALCFEGPEEILRLTRYTQPAILAVSLAALSCFDALGIEVNLVATAGHSLGEYGALVAAGYLNIEQAASLVRERAALMAESQGGAMSAVLGLTAKQVAAAIAPINETNQGPVVVANDNTPAQIVISGRAPGVEAATPKLKEAGAKRVIPLAVSGAFHSPLMAEAAESFASVVSEVSFAKGDVPVVTNVDAVATVNPVEVRAKLARQIASPVRWNQTMKTLFEDLEVNTVIEFGPGAVLTGMVKKCHPQVTVHNVSDWASLEGLREALREPVLA